jgi:acyl carrier protein
MEKKEVLCINDVGSLGEYLSKLGIVVPTEKTSESETAKVVKRLLKELDSWDGNSLADRLNDEVGMDGLDIIEFIMKLEEELDILLVEAENLFLTEQDVANDYYGVEEDDENVAVQDEESEDDDSDNETHAMVSPTVGEVIAYVEWLADNNMEPS